MKTNRFDINIIFKILEELINTSKSGKIFLAINNDVKYPTNIAVPPIRTNGF